MTVFTHVVVIGHFPAYIELAEQLGARRFSLAADDYDRMTGDARWSANQGFLDAAIADGCMFILATAPSGIRPGSVFEREIAYILSIGWQLVERDGRWEMGP